MVYLNKWHLFIDRSLLSAQVVRIVMAPLDPTVARVLDSNPQPNSDDEDELISSLEDDADPTFTTLREQRLQQLHNEFARVKQFRNQEHGTYHEIKDEKMLMDITTETKLSVVHFFKPDFNKCRIMDGHLEVI